MIIEKLNWDSEFFGIKIGKVTIDEQEDFNPVKFKEQAKDEGYELIYVFKFQNMLSWEIVKKEELDLVDIQLTMTKKFNKEDYLDIPYDFRTELTKIEKKECYRIAEETSIVSRFYKEKKMGPIITKELYRKWIDNALNQSFADGIFLVKENDTVIGIHVIKTDIINKSGNCSIIGVAPNYQGRGIGNRLWNQSFGYWASEHDIDHCKVPFSLQNIGSFNFHLKMGFNKVDEIKYIYHYRNENYK